jgi:hypothetical protein
MPASWPTTVRQYALAGITIKRETNRVEFKPEVGPAKRRRRSSLATELLNFRTRVTIDEYADLDDFFTIDLKDGTFSFMRKDPRDLDGTDCEFEFVEPPAFNHIDGDYGDITLSLRKLP